MKDIRKIVVIGPESTGKTSLCELLAAHFQTEWCPEYAREYLLAHGNQYSFDDLLTIAKGQVDLEDQFLKSVVQEKNRSPMLFIDTDQYVMKVWCEFVFDRCHQWILDQIVLRKYDLYLLCKTDLPWVKDELREYPDLENREILFHIYRDIMINQNTPWVEISGDYDQRIKMAMDAVNKSIGQ
jgi:NadR type nicotinamide-nucleotide adenylyltransferase